MCDLIRVKIILILSYIYILITILLINYKLIRLHNNFQRLALLVQLRPVNKRIINKRLAKYYNHQNRHITEY